MIEQVVRTLATAVPDEAVIGIDASGTVRVWTVGAERLLGYTPEEIVGQSYSALFSEADRKWSTPDLLLRDAALRQYVDFFGLHQRRGRSALLVQLAICVVRDEGGGVAGFVEVAQDFTDARDEELMSQQAVRDLVTKLVGHAEGTG